MLYKSLFTAYSLLFAYILNAQYAPAAGEPNSDAIHKDSSIIKGWATMCTVSRGYIDVSDTLVTYTQSGTTSNRAFFGADTLALGYPGSNMSTVSLGDGGSAIVQFEVPIANGEGPDFVIFENGFQVASPPQQYFLELAFVEVSSDGVHFTRFPSYSATDTSTQIGGFGQLDPTKIHNLAGKYIVDYGTPFDLDDLKDSVSLDITNITHVKLIDVIGNISTAYANYDSQGRPINDPWPTPFWTGGFDLNAVGVVHYQKELSVKEGVFNNEFDIFPNPVKRGGILTINNGNNTPIDASQVYIYDFTGSLVYSSAFGNTSSEIVLPQDLQSGVYIIDIVGVDALFSFKLNVE